MRNNVMDRLAARGNTFTFEEALKFLPTGYSVTKIILSKLEKGGYIQRIEKGKYILIPLVQKE